MAYINAYQNHAAYIGINAVDAIYVGSTLVWGDVVTYTAMRAMAAHPTNQFTLTGTSAAGSFTAVETDATDNGGTVIDSNTPGVKWVRDGTYNTAEAPMLLSWFERSKNGPLIAENSNISQTIERIVQAPFPEPGDLPLPYTADTVGMWLFDGNLEEYSQQTFNPRDFYLQAPFPVWMSALSIPYGHVILDLAGPIALQVGLDLGSETEVDQYVPRGKLFGFDTGPFHMQIDHNGLASTEQLLTPPDNKQALNINVTSVANGTTLRIATGFNVDRIVVEKSGISRNPLRMLVRPQDAFPITFLPGMPWRKVMDVPGFPDLIGTDALVFDTLLNRYVFEARVPAAGGISTNTAGYWTFDGTLDAAAATINTVHPVRRIYFDDWDAANLPIMSFWYRSTAPLTATAFLEPSGSPRPADIVAIPWEVTANDDWQQADINVGALLSGNPNGARVRAVEFNASRAGYYRLAEWE